MKRYFWIAGLLVLALTGRSFAQAAPSAAEYKRLLEENQKLQEENKRLRNALKAGGQNSSATAVVDLKRVYDSLREKITVESELKTREQVFEAEREKRETKVKDLQETLKGVALGTPEYIKVQDQLEQALGAHRIWITIEAGKINRDRANWIKKIYTKMMDSIDQVASVKGYDLVLFKIPPIDFAEVAAGEVAGKIATRKVLWSVDELDLTDAVIQRMNTAFLRDVTSGTGE